MLSPASEGVKDISHVGLIARADEVGDVVDDYNRGTVVDDILLYVFQNAMAVEFGVGIERIQRLDDEIPVTGAVVEFIGTVS